VEGQTACAQRVGALYLSMHMLGDQGTSGCVALWQDDEDWLSRACVSQAEHVGGHLERQWLGHAVPPLRYEVARDLG